MKTEIKPALSFTDLLTVAGLDPSTVKLHRHSGHEVAASPYSLWFAEREQFELYQALQSDPNTMNRDYIASFVVTPSFETLFVGIYKNHGSQGRAPQGQLSPVTGLLIDAVDDLYQLEKTEHLSGYQGRLVIYWDPKAARKWAQNADGESPKPILEIKRDIAEASFPGFHNFILNLAQLNTIPISWKERLSQMQGIYLVVCLDSGSQYVGAAYGDGGFYGRWQDYFLNGHGGNEGLKSHVTSGYQISILEVASSSDTLEDICAKESSWKVKLMSRKFSRLNQN